MKQILTTLLALMVCTITWAQSPIQKHLDDPCLEVKEFTFDGKTLYAIHPLPGIDCPQDRNSFYLDAEGSLVCSGGGPFFPGNCSKILLAAARGEDVDTEGASPIIEEEEGGIVDGGPDPIFINPHDTMDNEEQSPLQEYLNDPCLKVKEFAFDGNTLYAIHPLPGIDCPQDRNSFYVDEEANLVCSGGGPFFPGNCSKILLAAARGEDVDTEGASPIIEEEEGGIVDGGPDPIFINPHDTMDNEEEPIDDGSVVTLPETDTTDVIIDDEPTEEEMPTNTEDTGDEKDNDDNKDEEEETKPEKQIGCGNLGIKKYNEGVIFFEKTPTNYTRHIKAFNNKWEAITLPCTDCDTIPLENGLYFFMVSYTSGKSHICTRTIKRRLTGVGKVYVPKPNEAPKPLCEDVTREVVDQSLVISGVTDAHKVRIRVLNKKKRAVCVYLINDGEIKSKCDAKIADDKVILPLETGEYFVTIKFYDENNTPYCKRIFRKLQVGTDSASRSRNRGQDATEINTPITTFDGHAEAMSVFPNPASEQLTVELPAYTSDRGAIKLISSFGQIVRDIPVQTDYSSQTQLDVDGLAGGVYLLHVVVDREIVASKKVMISK